MEQRSLRCPAAQGRTAGQAVFRYCERHRGSDLGSGVSMPQKKISAPVSTLPPSIMERSRSIRPHRCQRGWFARLCHDGRLNNTEGFVFRLVVWRSIALGAIVAIIVILCANVLSHAVCGMSQHSAVNA